MDKLWDEMQSEEKLAFLRNQFFALQRAFRDLIPLCQKLDERLQEIEKGQRRRIPE